MFDIILTYALLATGIVANKYILHSISPDLFVGIRMFVAGLILFVGSLIREGKRFRWSYIRVDLPSLLFISLCTTLLPSLTKAFALKYMTASKTALLGSIDPFVTAVYAYILWQEKLSIKQVIGMMVGLLGVITAIISTSSTELAWGEFLYLSYPELAALGSVIISRYGWILVQMLLKKDRYRPAEINSITMLVSGALALGIAWWTGASIVVAPQERISFVALCAYTIIMGNLCGYTLYSYCLRRHRATWMSFSGFLVPVFVISLSRWLMHEELSWPLVGAAGLLFAGLCIFYYDELKKSRL